VQGKKIFWHFGLFFLTSLPRHFPLFYGFSYASPMKNSPSKVCPAFIHIHIIPFYSGCTYPIYAARYILIIIYIIHIFIHLYIYIPIPSIIIHVFKKPAHVFTCRSFHTQYYPLSYIILFKSDTILIIPASLSLTHLHFTTYAGYII
jgi:hypothetical protein